MKALKLVGAALAVGLLVLVLPIALELVVRLFPGAGTATNIGDKLAGGALVVPLALIFLGGLATAATPCVYPLIPITVAIFGAKKGVGRGRAVSLTLTYILGIAVMFTTAGILAALSGNVFGSALGKPWVFVSLAILFAVFGVMMFGVGTMDLPSGLKTRLDGFTKRSGFAGAFLMGLVAGIVAAPCTGPVLSGVLLHVATTRSVPLGASLLFTYALGLGLPFFLIGALSLSLPKSGAWMDTVKSIFGIALLALAFMTLRDGIPSLKESVSLASVSFGAWIAAGLVVVGVAMGALHRTFHDGAVSSILKAAGVLLVIAGLVTRAHASMGTVADSAVWSADEAATVAAAKGVGPVIIDFGAEWCASCKELEHKTFRHPLFLAEAEGWKLVRIDATNEDAPEIQALQKKYGVRGLPTVILIDSSGQVREDLTVTGFEEAPAFVERMKKVQRPSR